jgi:hypothetical protein
MNSHQLDKFRNEHAISKEVWDTRPYSPYTAADPETVREAFAAFTTNQQTWAANKANASDGLLMMQHEVPNLELLPIPPQLRPDRPIPNRESFYWDYHPWKLPPDDEVVIRPDGKPFKGQSFTTLQQRRHILRDRDATDHHGAGVAAQLGYHTPDELRRLLRDKTCEADLLNVLRQANREDVHFHVRLAKYLLCCLPRYADGKVNRDPRLNPGKRIDVHPLAWELLAAAEVVFFVIEGKIKADAVLTAILARGLPASVCSVPSVGMWDALELEEFARRDLAGKLVVVVPDSDFVDNPQVMTHALLLRGRLRDLGLKASVAAPPLDFVDHEGKPAKGVDDYLAARWAKRTAIAVGVPRALGGLAVFDFEVPEDARVRFETEFTERMLAADGKRPRRDRIERAWRTMVGLSELAGESGEVKASVKKIARFIRASDDSVERALNRDLLRFCFVDADIPLKTAKGIWRTNHYRDPGRDWVYPTTLTILDSAYWSRAVGPKTLIEFFKENGLQSAVWEEGDTVTPQTGERIATALERIADAVEHDKPVDPEHVAAQLSADIDAWNAGSEDVR